MKTITTLLAALALVALAAACTSEMEAGIEGRTITVDLGTKPTYTEPNTDNPNTRTNPTTGQWEVGDKVEVTFSFLNGGSSLGTQTQTLTCIKAAITTAPTAPAQWSAAPAILIAPAGATSVNVDYNYTSAPDPRTGTKEEISYAESGIALPTTGTLTMPDPKWLRGTALVVVKNIPDGSTAEIGSAQWQNNTGAPASANFHLATGAPNPTFTLKIDGVATPYKDVPYKAGNKYTIDARAQEPGTGGGNNQTITASSTNLPTDFFITNPSSSFIITGTEVDKVATTLGNVIGTKKINLTMPDVTTQVGKNAFQGCTALTDISLPLAESIGNYAFYNCGALTTISLPKAKDIGISAFQGCTALTDMSLLLAETIGNHAFNGCTALTTISLPAATKFGWNAFHSCTALTRLELTAATAITVDSDTFTGINNNDPITLVLHSSAANAGNNMGITVEDGTGEDAGKKTVAFANTVDFNDSPTAAATIDVKAVVDPSGNPITTIN